MQSDKKGCYRELKKKRKFPFMKKAQHVLCIKKVNLKPRRTLSKVSIKKDPRIKAMFNSNFLIKNEEEILITIKKVSFNAVNLKFAFKLYYRLEEQNGPRINPESIKTGSEEDRSPMHNVLLRKNESSNLPCIYKIYVAFM